MWRELRETPRELHPSLEPAGFNRCEIGKLNRFESDARAPLSPSADGHDRHLVGEIEAMKGYLLAHEADPIEPPKHFLDTGEPGRGLLVFTIGIGESQRDASLDRLALLHLREKIWHVQVAVEATGMVFGCKRYAEGALAAVSQSS
jgi:hypothetical protein